MRFPAPRKIEFFAIVEGSCELVLDGCGKTKTFEAGDVFLLSAPRAYVLRTDAHAPEIDAVKLYEQQATQQMAVGEGEGFFALVGNIDLDDTAAGLLLDVLDPVICVNKGSADAATLRWLIDEYVREYRSVQAGSYLTCAGIAQLLFVRILRGYLENGTKPAGWLKAVADPRLAEPLRLMHGDPARDWTLGELARAAGMSRTTFAVYFKQVAGLGPVTYLTEWRMRLAERSLREDNRSIAVIAKSVGYASDAAFSNAFKRVMGQAPSHYRAARLPGVRSFDGVAA